MKDRYLYFTFNGIKSSEFGCFYENTGEQLSFPMFPEFSDNISTPMYQERSYYQGTNITNKKFSLKCACDAITMSRFRELERWLDIKTIGDLSFGFNQNFHYRVKISDLSDVTIYPLNERKTTFYAEFTVSFITVEDAAAISNIEYNTALYSKDILLDYDYRLPIIDYITNSNLNSESPQETWNHRVRIFNYQTYPFYPKIINNNTNMIKLKLFDKNYNSNGSGIVWNYYNLQNWTGSGTPTTWSDIPNQYNNLINSEHGYAIDAVTNKMFEEIYQDHIDRQTSFINKGPFKIESGDLKQHSLLLNSITQEGTGYKLTFLPTEDTYSLEDYNYGTLSGGDIVENTNYKGIIIQMPGVEDYLLYNEGEYGDGYYFVNKQYYFISYKFNVSSNLLEVILPSVSQDEMNFFNNYLQQELKVSIANYTEMKIKSQYLANFQASPIATNDFIKFNLRTML